MIEQKLFYVIYEDDYGNEETVEVLAPNEQIARALMGPVVIIDIIEIEDEDFANNLFDIEFELDDDEEIEWN